MADPQIKDVFDSIRIPPIGPREANSTAFWAGTGSPTATMFGQSSYPVNMVPSNVGGEKVYNKRLGFSKLSSSFVVAVEGVAGGSGWRTVNGKYVGVIATFQTSGQRLAAADMGNFPELNDSVLALIAWNSTDNAYRCYILGAGNSSSAYLIGSFSLPTNSGPTTVKLDFSEAMIGVTPHLLINCYCPTLMGSTYAGASVGYRCKYDIVNWNKWDTTTFQKITDVDYPGNVTGVGVVGPLIQSGSFILALSHHGYIYNSDLNSVDNWSASAYIYAFPQPDKGMRLERFKNHVMAFGEKHITFFNNVGQASSTTTPMQMMDQATIRMGCTGPQAVATNADVCYWIAQDNMGIRGLYRMNQYQPEPVSGPQENVILRNLSIYSYDHRLSWLNINGTHNLMIGGLYYQYQPTLLSQAIYSGDPDGLTGSLFNYGILAYSMDADEFWQFNVSEATLGAAFPLSVYNNAIGGYGSQHIVYCPNTVVPDNRADNFMKIFYSDILFQNYYETYYPTTRGTFSTTAAATVACGLQTKTFTFDTEKRKRIHKLKLIGDFHKTSTSHWTWFLWHKADGNIASAAGSYPIYSRAIENNTTTNKNTRSYISNLGISRMWTFGIAEYNANKPLSIRAFEIDLSLCQS